MKAFLDTNIVMYAAGTGHPHKTPCLTLLQRIVQTELDAVCDSEVLQELLYRYWHLKMLEQGRALVAQVVRIVPAILPVDKADVLLASDLLKEHKSFEPRDAVHAAVMLNHGMTQIFSYDRHFDLIPELKRLEP